ncbi:LamG domain-containing protein [Pseudaquabacterium rugosum]|uniref:LamG domain-containing protein n=1 Tax=Pseudaquabacterium rugosum TaxID=2984194 RepID=A0ABU9BGS4_9BURK
MSPRPIDAAPNPRSALRRTPCAPHPMRQAVPWRSVQHLLALLALAVGLLLPASVRAALVAEYRFEESGYSGVAGEALDASGNGRHATAVGGVTTTASGKTCRGLDVNTNTSSSALALNTGIALPSTVGGTGSISFWYYSTSTDSSDRVLMDATTANGAQFLIYRDDDSASPSTIDVDLGFTVNSASGAEHAVFKNDAMSDGAWWHITVTWKLVAGSGASRIRTYVNGSIMSEATFTVALPGLASGIGTLYIGDNRSSATPIQRSADGHFDTVRIYNHELTTTEINADRTATPACSLLHHLELASAAASVSAGAATSFTVKACANASCSSLYTGGVSGSLSSSGTPTASWSSGPAFTIASGASTATVQAAFSPGGSVTLGSTGVSPAATTAPALYCGFGVTAAAGNSCALTVVSGLHHVRIAHAGAGQGVTCAPATLTLIACQNADCSTRYTGGVSGTLGISDTQPGMSVGWPDTTAFTIAAGASTTTMRAHVTKAGTLKFLTENESPAPASTNRCDFGSPECTHTSATSGFLFDIPHHVSDLTKTITVSAVKTDDASLACTPAFASVTKSIQFSCTYLNPASGTRAVRLGPAGFQSALNASANANAACDAGGRAIGLDFNASGVATTTLRYADVGQMRVSASYTGTTVYESGLSMTGSDTFVAQPWYLAVTVAAGAKVAGTPFTATLQAINNAGAVTPNFGRESPPETAQLNFVRARPTGAGAVSGTFSASLGSFVNGVAAISDIRYDEVGTIDLTTLLTSADYLGTGWNTGGGSNLSVFTCAADGATCTLPTGVVAIVAYGTTTAWRTLGNRSGSLPCTVAQFGGVDPAPGQTKTCFYLATSGINSASSGSVGPFIPHHLDLTASAACLSGGYTYAGQPTPVTVTARNAAGGVTRNYDGTAATSPTYAKTVTLTATPTPSVAGSTSADSLAASAFSQGVGSGAPVYAFSSKTSGPATLRWRATDASGVSSAPAGGGSEASVLLRSGRLRLLGRYGPAAGTLRLPLRAEYWSGSSWVPHTADHCTTLSTAQIALSAPRGADGRTVSANSSVLSITPTLSAGLGELTLAAPTPTGTSVLFDVALNLGATATDASCNGLRPSTSGGLRPWLRSQWGACASGWAADPAARAGFGIYRPEWLGDPATTLRSIREEDLP